MKKQTRLTVDMTPEEHMYLKMASAKIGISMREMMLSAVFKALQDIEDEWLAAKARETLQRIQSGEETTTSWETAKKQLKK